MITRINVCFIALFSVISQGFVGLGQARADEPRKSSYSASYGELNVLSIGPASIDFDFSSKSNMGGGCNLERSKAKKLRPGAYRFSDSDGCVIDLTFGSASHLSVHGSESCQSYCGASAGMGGEFAIKPKECETLVIKQNQASFKRLYQAKKFKEASQTLGDLLERCKLHLPVDQIAEMRSDLSVAAYRVGDKKRCLEQIRLAREENPNLDPEDSEGLPSSPVYDSLKKTAKSLSFNEKKCSGR